MNYAIIHDNQVTRIVNSSDSAAALKKMFAADDVRSVSESYTYIGDARAIDWTTQTIKPLSQQIEEGIATVPEGFIFENGSFRAMTYTERIEAGLDALPDGMKIADGALVAMTRDERFDAGQITAAQYNAEARAERHARYTTEADRLYMEYVYDTESGKATDKKKLWMDKVAEIKAALPLKVE